MKTRVAVLFGGRSVEHEISILSGLQALSAFNRDRYEPFALYLAKDGRLFVGEGLDQVSFYRGVPASLDKAVRVLPLPAGGGADFVRWPVKKWGNNIVAHCDAVLPVVHGTNAEDGTVMGFLEMLGVPYAGSDVTASALGMDKYKMKAVLRAAGLPVLDAVVFSSKRFLTDPLAAAKEAEAAFPYPMIVKPVNLGSSVGITKVEDRDHLESALELALDFSPQALVERAVSPLREINCSVLGDRDEARASVCEEPFGSDEILSYSDKYLSGDGKAGGKSSGMSGLRRRCPADLPGDLAAKIQDLAVRTFQAVGCGGVARVDFLLDARTGEVWVNEINTIPGSLSFYLWEASGIPFADLLDRLIALAFKRQREREALTFTYDTNILSAAGRAGAKK